MYLAMSCLQGRPMADAFDALSALSPDGIQLTPGCRPTPGFAVHVSRAGRPYRTHHGFSWRHRKREVWDPDGTLQIRVDSAHPPEDAPLDWLEHWAASSPATAIETMYPGHALGTGAALDRAMDLGVPLAVDVSHLYIQRCAGVLPDSTWRRLQDHPAIAEVHVSANDGRADQHRPIRPDTFGLPWARARARAGTPLVLESYLHALDSAARQDQLMLLRTP